MVNIDPTVRPFRIEVPEEDLADLWERLARTRWPDPECVEDWSQGIPLVYVQELSRYWAGGYDWRACEARRGGMGTGGSRKDPIRPAGAAK